MRALIGKFGIFIKKIVCNEEGSFSGYIWTAFVIIAVIYLGLISFEKNRQDMIFSQIRESMRSSVLIIIIDNYDDIFSGFKNAQGITAKYDEALERFEIVYDYGKVFSQIDKELGLIVSSNDHYKAQMYKLKDVSVYPQSIELDGSGAMKFHIQIEAVIVAPSTFAANIPYKYTIKTTASYTPKF